MAAVAGDEVGQIPVALDEPAVESLVALLLGADSAHGLLQAAEHSPIPVEIASELDEE